MAKEAHRAGRLSSVKIEPAMLAMYASCALQARHRQEKQSSYLVEKAASQDRCSHGVIVINPRWQVPAFHVCFA